MHPTARPALRNVSTVILAGGQGQRLRPLTDRRCKPAVPFGATFRIMDFTLMSAAASGLSRIDLLTQYRPETVERHVAQRWRPLSRLGIAVGTRPSATAPYAPPGSLGYCGTADAVFQNRDLIADEGLEAALVLSGDHIYHADYRALLELHAAQDADVTVLTGSIPAAEASQFGVLQLSGSGDGARIVRFVEKPADPTPYAREGECAINLGVYCFRPGFLREWLGADAADPGSSHDFGKDVLPAAVARGARVAACPLERVTPTGRPYWRDVGTKGSLLQANLDVLSGAFQLVDPRWPNALPFRAWANAVAPRGGNVVAPTARVDGATLERCVVSAGAVVEPGCRLEECVVLPGAVVRRGAILRRRIVDVQERLGSLTRPRRHQPAVA